MEAKMKDIKITPIKYDKNGDITKEEFATLSVEIPMHSGSQRQAVIDLLSLLSREFIHVDVYSPRKQKEDGSVEVTHTSPTGKTQTVSLNQDDVNAQLETLEEMQE